LTDSVEKTPHLEDDPVQTGPARSAAGVDYVSISLTTLYQANDPASAQTLSPAYSDAAAKTPAAQAASAVPGLPQSRCTRVAGSSGLVPHYGCLASAGRYTIKTVARQLDSAHRGYRLRLLIGSRPRIVESPREANRVSLMPP